MIKLYCGDFRKIIDSDFPQFDTCFCDPPDNLKLNYDSYKDNLSEIEYEQFLSDLIDICIKKSKTSYISFYNKYITTIGHILYSKKNIQIKWLIQGFSFGQHKQTDFGNNFRPIVRLSHFDAPLFPNSTRIESDRMKQGDKRADPKGRVPGDVWFSDFLDYPRVTGNSKQRRIWLPTQLNKGVIEDCLLMSTPNNGSVLDIFSGSGSTIDVCIKNNWDCTSIEISPNSCKNIVKEHNLKEIEQGIWNDIF